MTLPQPRFAHHADSENGQMLVIFAGTIAVFLLIAALVIDLGFVWMIHRQQQDAVDPGAVAAARYIVPSADMTKMTEAACFYARQNGYFAIAGSNDGCTPANDTAGATLAVHYPPSAAAGQYAGRSGYVEVVINQPQRTFFAGLAGMGTLNVSTSAVAAYDVGNSNSASLMALNPANCPQGGGTITGGANVEITAATGVTGPGGYVQVDSSCINSTPDNVCDTGSGQGSLNVNGGSSVTAPKIFTVGTCTGGGTVNGALTEGAAYVGDPLAGLRPPPYPTGGTPCAQGNKLTTAVGAEGCKFNGSGSVTLSPGTYYGGWDITGANVQINLNPGIYVIAGGGIKQTGGTLSSAGGRVLVYSTDDPYYAAACKAGTASQQNTQCQGVINLGGATNLSLTGLDRNSPCPPVSVAGQTGCPLGGMLIWQDGYGSAPASGVSLEGTTNLQLSGTIYAPKALVSITGNNVTTGCTSTGGNYDCVSVQIISDTWKIGGGVLLQMPYDPNLLYQLPLKGLVR